MVSLDRIYRLAARQWARIRRLAPARQERLAFGVSAGMHAVLLLVLAAIFLPLARIAEPDAVTSEWNAEEPLVSLERRIEPAPQPLALAPPGPAGGGSFGNSASAELSSPEDVADVVTVYPAIQAVTLFDLEPRLPPGGELGRSAIGRRRSSGKGAGSGFGALFGDGIGLGDNNGFFDLPSQGTKFVFVLDCSGSMREEHGGGRSRFDRLKIELIHSIGGMAPEAEFFVIFFNQQAVPMPAEALVAATLENKRKYLEWVAKLPGGGGTDPRDAVKRAVDLHPDIIYLLTDGVLDRDAPDDVTKLNTGGVTIHTICLGDAAGAAMLEDIAHRNHGTYKFVPAGS